MKHRSIEGARPPRCALLRQLATNGKHKESSEPPRTGFDCSMVYSTYSAINVVAVDIIRTALIASARDWLAKTKTTVSINSESRDHAYVARCGKVAASIVLQHQQISQYAEAYTRGGTCHIPPQVEAKCARRAVERRTRGRVPTTEPDASSRGLLS